LMSSSSRIAAPIANALADGALAADRLVGAIWSSLVRRNQFAR
jgi:hypothetical protein